MLSHFKALALILAHRCCRSIWHTMRVVFRSLQWKQIGPTSSDKSRLCSGVRVQSRSLSSGTLSGWLSLLRSSVMLVQEVSGCRN